MTASGATIADGTPMPLEQLNADNVGMLRPLEPIARVDESGDPSNA